MFKLLFKYVIPLALMLATLLVGYNYYFGTEDEQQQSKEIIAKFTDLGSEVIDLLSSETQKFDEGKFDDALVKISDRIKQLSESASAAGQDLMGQIKGLDEQKLELETQLSNLRSGQDHNRSSPNGWNNSQSQSAAPQSVAELGAQIEALAEKTQQLSSEMMQQQ